MSGLCLAVKLQQAGIDSYTIYEKATEVGGTWRENRYPGLSCDVPSRYYSYSFEPNPDWTHWMSPGWEIQRYFQGVADRYDLRRHIEFGVEVKHARFRDGRWRIELSDGRSAEADVLVSACGILHHPRVPEIEGAHTFAGAMFHSARWQHDVPLAGRRVGVVGTGSTGVQIVCGLAGKAARLELFQRTAQWIYPAPNPRYSRASRWLLRRFPQLNRVGYRFWQHYVHHSLGRAAVEPGFQRWVMSASCRLHLRTIRDPALRRALTPDTHPMCKRLVVSGRFYRAIQQPHVALVTEAIERIEPAGIRTRDGVLHELDVIVLATGFDAHAYLRPIELEGPGGVTLEEAWRDGPRAYRTVALPGFPNFFMMMGPHSPVGNQSLVTIAESQAEYIVRWAELLRDGRIAAAAPRADATDRFNAEMRAAMPNTIWTSGCNSWYLGKDGNPELWPWRPERHLEMLREPALEEFELHTG